MAAEQLKESMMNSLRNNPNITSPSFYTDVVGFYHAVNWAGESWLQALGVFQLSVWLLAVLTRKSSNAQMMLLFIVLGLVYSAEWLNRLGARHWEDFATQNYFDPRGVFISVVYSTPLLTAAFGILINALRSTAHLLVEVKKLQFKKEAKVKRKGTAAEVASAPQKKEQ
mmetsp:Transcript_3912/g.8471  ORF Transcript_3912/g.8471 Transcript_3912/m.8471 type:complete len:169 (-) Transcript_3912:191-697(-)|eukprot:CAMPEP_0183351662 /NCGR_PEP_ID=MMETSP0164_2-20130417/26175_1 /TAXON_ID=221442 /ORGANISM="Coccolithus pelagicus ssp braarudi, Strain PLY182g" /LENGTH=168 /DNA_ID=CAMNT_0025523901 /DNA_START=20 /DNA_END=526 /DNA_ORIENTATION=+